ncbi:hypothetical protein scyTo_0004083 [Scyliorhinus torazame]|uniref:DNA recombination and repair protein Rad51-like C-terminal domain-containing protein n=1 Tax=Scyliorhinus torazame TaxID=75743 RepID=A0A401NKK5_SCYTO|nr:hypothetical protein [Scyliorhinus torazame]
MMGSTSEQLSLLIERLSGVHDVVILTNQITTRLNQNRAACSVPGSGVGDSLLPEDCGVSPDGETSYATAALGNTWSHSVNTRLIMQYLDYHSRQIIIAKSPLAPFALFVFTIQDAGLALQETKAAAVGYDLTMITGPNSLRTPMLGNGQTVHTGDLMALIVFIYSRYSATKEVAVNAEI